LATNQQPEQTLNDFETSQRHDRGASESRHRVILFGRGARLTFCASREILRYRVVDVGIDVSTSPKKRIAVAVDWDPIDIVAALHKRGITLRRLSAQHGFSPRTLSVGLQRPYPLAENIIASALGKPARVIWPSRHKARRRTGCKSTRR
jgi:Ner family transcriptional regulator